MSEELQAGRVKSDSFILPTFSLDALSLASVMRRERRRRTPGHLLGEDVGFRLLLLAGVFP
jgi:hypothetical protein